LLPHFLALSENDRLLRFGQIVPDRVIENYVRGIDFARDAVFGVYGDRLELLGVGHLGYLPDEGMRTAELGISVLQTARGRTVGSKLFERAAIHCRNTRVTVLYMQCLSRNSTMMHIAKKAGMRLIRLRDEAPRSPRLTHARSLARTPDGFARALTAGRSPGPTADPTLGTSQDERISIECAT
jgi:RimJ/RimL family protein N-acetyltransferase